MENRVRIVLADDHTILREGLRALLSTDSNFEIVAEAEDGRDFPGSKMLIVEKDCF